MYKYPLFRRGRHGGSRGPASLIKPDVAMRLWVRSTIAVTIISAILVGGHANSCTAIAGHSIDVRVVECFAKFHDYMKIMIFISIASACAGMVLFLQSANHHGYKLPSTAAGRSWDPPHAGGPSPLSFRARLALLGILIFILVGGYAIGAILSSNYT
ncbi:MAG: hypothetical protein MPK62_01140 [Alphaproteobacteria bacterium]|nr:hypothetical protein [Alphaproteobacteria bacterium]MDA8029740.1 hypothetical protein [Alphaproteobacteria bacterium]